MKIFSGKGVCGGISIGKLNVIFNNNSTVKRMHIDDIEKEITRFRNAKNRASEELRKLYEKALKEIGETNASIFEIHQMMLDDEDYVESVENIIKTQSVNAEYAVLVTSDNFSDMFSRMDDEYMKARSADVKDISERIINAMNESVKEENKSDEPSIILAYDLAPSQTVQLDKDRVLSFVTSGGSSNSHTAILAKSMNIPSIIGCNINITDSLDGKFAIVDGFTGKLYLEPTDDILEEMRKKQREDKEKQELLFNLKGKENITLDGKKINLYANIGNVRDLASVFMNDAEGIGLFRSEFIYLERDEFPSEEEQFRIYRQVAETMAGKKVIIRTLDIGADKQADYFNLEKEENPAMGYRAIRICIKQPNIFKTQLKAIFRASVFGNISVMYPMITSVSEISKIKEIVQEVKNELNAEQQKFTDIPQGIMIETPASAIISDVLAKEVDFFSIGTNDLTQYLLAVDRQNSKIDDFYDDHHPALLRLIKYVIENAHNNGIWAGICGELGADTSLTETFLKMGIDELSVSPSEVLKVRKKIREINLSK
ncbi:MAG: phosphoenolpyruvate--protein phosphotransferase [Oscillospiraceae bacterium]|nr:phosphoenolpyruvate--protein phosphotransferase [Oscillospiraceae bacterium]